MNKPLNHRVSPIDENHLLYGKFIGLQYVFKGGLDAEVLAESVAELADQLPALSGRYQTKTASVISSSTKASVKIQTANGSIADILASEKRLHYIEQPARKDVLRGEASLSTFTLTEFEDGGVVFGMAISHVLTDAAGYHLLMRHLADIYTAVLTRITLPDFTFATHIKAFELSLIHI